MGKKYIVEIGRLERLYKASVNGNGKPNITWLSPRVDLTPYTEPDLEQVRCQAYEEGRNSLLIEVQKAGKNTIKLEEDEYYQRGLSDAWEAARTLWNTTNRKEIFGYTTFNTVLMALTAQEAIEKIRQYEQEQDRQASIEYNFDEIKDVLETTAKECNVSLDEIAEVLRKMKENSDGNL